MTREWVSGTTPWWVMRCDRHGCKTVSERFLRQPPLEMFRDRGWFIAKCHGDRCPTCLGAGHPARAKPFVFTDENKGV